MSIEKDCAAIAADVLHHNSDVLSAYVAPCGPCGGRAVRLRGFRSVGAVKANGYLSPDGASDIVGVAVGDLCVAGAEGLAGSTWASAAVGVRRRRSPAERSKVTRTVTRCGTPNIEHMDYSIGLESSV